MRNFLRIAIGIMLGSMGLVTTQTKAQLKVGKNPTSVEKSAILEMDADKQGLLLPRLNDTLGIQALNPPDGMVIYLKKTGEEGFYVRNHGYWERMANMKDMAQNFWSTNGNANALAGDFIGTTNTLPFSIKANNVEGIVVDNGYTFLKKLDHITTGVDVLLIDQTTGKVSSRTISESAFQALVIGAFSNTGVNDGLSIDNSDPNVAPKLILHAADAIHPGAVTTTAQSFEGVKTFLQNINGNENLNIAGTGTIGTGLTVTTGGATIGGNSTVTGNLSVNGPSGNLAVAGTSNLAGTLDVSGATTLNNTLGVTGATTLGSTLNVTGAAALANNLQVNGNTTLDQTLTLTNIANGTTENEVLIRNATTGQVVKRTLPATAFDGAIGSINGLKGPDVKLVYARNDNDVKITTNNTLDTMEVAINIPDAATTAFRGLVTNDKQSFAGVKRFADSVYTGKTLMVGDTIAGANSTLQVKGSVSMPLKVVTANYTVAAEDYTIVAKNGSSTSTTSLTITLPSAAGIAGRMYTIKKVPGTAGIGNDNNIDNPIIIAAAAGQFIENGSSTSIYNDWTFVTLQSDGINTWYIIKK